MGGHEHHREGQKSSRSGPWEGSEKLKQALGGLSTAKGVSQSRIGAVAKLAAHYSKHYKHVVHDIETFLWKAEIEHRLAGLYAIDAIIRQMHYIVLELTLYTLLQSHAKNPKDAYIKRFLIRMSDTIAAVKKVPNQFQPKVYHVIDEWQKRGLYTSKQIEDAGGRDYLSSRHESRSENGTPRTSPGKLASLLSIIKQKKELAGEQQEQQRYNDSFDEGIDPKDNASAYNHQQYDEQRREDPQLDCRGVVGIMGDAPTNPIGSNRVQRDLNDRADILNDRDFKKARGSRWGPPKLDNMHPNDRPAPIVTSFDKDENHRQDSSSAFVLPPESIRQTAILQSSHGGPSRHEEWNRNIPSNGSGLSWPRESVRSPQSRGLGRQTANPYEQANMQRAPFISSDDRRSPGNRVPGTSGEVCRNYLAGRCTFGDRCWHIHDSQAAIVGGSRSEIAESKRKTVLCNNFPMGMCRFGDKCSFAHGEKELDKSARYPPRPAANSELNGSRWQPSPGLRQGMTEQQTLIPPSFNAPPFSQVRTYVAPQVHNEQPNDDRGTSSASYANTTKTAASPQVTLVAPPQGYPSSAPPPYGVAYTIQKPSYSSEVQDRSYVSNNVSVLPPSGSGYQLYGEQPSSGAKVLADDDEVDTAEPEFTLEYDDDD
ncbi:hypothetical protein CCR75_000132 [Bremia lactucae]|uniref:C3H1-type domain-containing protein n=1 Tax=Bremia lactucae TaxID=4779 RepID=A0A976IDY6_BRELC|nr:hypothetical protein CCR75_000132 [Bremia lactucae]